MSADPVDEDSQKIIRRRGVAFAAGLVVLASVGVGLLAYGVHLHTPQLWITLGLAVVLAGVQLVVVRSSRWPIAATGPDTLACYAFVCVLGAVGMAIMSHVFPWWLWLLLTLPWGVVILGVGFLLTSIGGVAFRTIVMTVGTAIGILGGAWVAVSMAGMTLSTIQQFRAGQDAEARARVLRLRQARLEQWAAAGAPVIALTLSGGGYRAAAVHAGILSVFDDARVPIHYLSTVSGGSIVGGAYAMGWAPRAFTERLRTRPRILDDFLTPVGVMSLLTAGDFGSGELFSLHLARTFFSDTELDKTGPPVLIVNTTAFHSGARVAFWRGSQPKDAPSYKLHRAVAASAAFPGAFSPVRVDEVFYYMDGGVRDNLGVEGLEQYLSARPEASTPAVVVLADVTVPLDSRFHAQRPSPVAAAQRAIDVLYTERHAYLLDRYEGTSAFVRQAKEAKARGDFGETFHWRPRARSAKDFWEGRSGPVYVFLLNLPREAGSTIGDVATLLGHAAALDTLGELSAEDVDLAFWAGRWLGRRHLEQICGVIGPLRCEPVTEDPLPDVASRILGRRR